MDTKEGKTMRKLHLLLAGLQSYKTFLNKRHITTTLSVSQRNNEKEVRKKTQKIRKRSDEINKQTQQNINDVKNKSSKTEDMKRQKHKRCSKIKKLLQFVRTQTRSLNTAGSRR